MTSDLKALSYQNYQQMYLSIRDTLLIHNDDNKDYSLYLDIIDKQPEILNQDKVDYIAFSNQEQQKEFIKFCEKLIDSYLSYVDNLQQGLQVLVNKKIIEPNEITSLSILSWDMRRLVDIARSCYDCGYISKEEAFTYIDFAYQKSIETYTSWLDFSKGYLVGRVMWNGKNITLNFFITVIKRLLKDKKSPWNQYPWK